MSASGTRTPSDDVDVCVIGAGPAGALVAWDLARRGHEVVILEAGPRFDETERLERMERAVRPGYNPEAVWDMGGERDAYATTGERDYPLNAARVKGVGGSTLHWQGMVFRFHEDDFRTQSAYGVGTDWPISYDDLRPYYARAESELGVSGGDDNPFAPPREEPFPMSPFQPSYSDSLFAEACERLGIATHSVPNARNSEAYDGRGACVGYGTCKPVCPSGAKYDASVHVAKAVAEGARVIDRAPVTRLHHDRTGDRVTAAEYVTPEGDSHRQTARRFVLAAGGVEVPRLLLMSRSERHPDGLANSSGLVGRYFMDHLFAGAGGLVDQRTRQNHVGFITSESHQFYDAGDADVGPYKLEFLNYAGPSPVELACGGDTWGDELLEGLREAYGNHVGLGGLVGQRPRKTNRISLHSDRTDHLGNPVPEITWSVGDWAERTISAANDTQHAILDELDATDRHTVGPGETGPAYHHMGTTRMGTDPETSVVDPFLRAHDCPNLSIASSSVFVTAGALNPTLTIAALSLKAADHLDEDL